MKAWLWGAVGTGICFFMLGVTLVLPLFSKEQLPDGLMSDVSSDYIGGGVGADLAVSNWFLVERGDTWNKYRNGTKPEYKIESFGDLINYRNDTGVYNEINISHLASSVDGSYSLSDTPYKFVLDSSRSFFTVYPDRNNKTRFIEMYLPSSFTMNNRPFWQNNPSLTSNTGSIRWSSPNYDIQLRCGNSHLYFELILKNSLTAVNSFNMTVIPHNMSIHDVGWLNTLTDALDITKPVIMVYNEVTHDMRLSFNTLGLTYPITVDPSLSFYSSASDGHIYMTDEATYDDAWMPTSGEYKWDTTILFYVGQSTSYSVRRGFLYFNTSSLIDDCLITSASITMKTTAIHNLHDSLVVQNGQPTYPTDPMVLSDFNKAWYSGDGGSQAMAAISGTFTFSLNATGLTWINKTDTTKLALRSSNDIAGIAPSGSELTNFYASENGVDMPKLTIIFFNNTFDFSGVTPLNGSLIDAMPTCNVTITHNLGYNFNYTLSENTTGSWVVQNSGNNVASGSKSFTFTNASVIGTTYYWMVSAVNGTTWHNETYNFIAFNLNTSVNTINPYNQSSTPLSITATGYNSLDNVTLFYRSSLDNVSWTRAYENCTDEPESNIDLGFPASTTLNFQTFTIGNSGENNTFLLSQITVDLMKAGSPTSFTIKLYSMNATGAPDTTSVLLATSDAYPGSGISGTEFIPCDIVFSTPYYLQRGVTYGITFSGVIPKLTHIYVGYYGSGTYPGGCRYTYSIDTHVTTQYATDDFYFIVYGAWINYNNAGNPDVSSPWSWSFDMTNNTFYEFFSQGKYNNQNETLANSADAKCKYVYVPPVPGSRSWHNLFSGYLSGGNITGWRNLFSGYMTGGNVSVPWRGLLSGYLTGGNATLLWRNIVSGYLTGGNNTCPLNISDPFPANESVVSTFISGVNTTVNVTYDYFTNGTFPTSITINSDEDDGYLHYGLDDDYVTVQFAAEGILDDSSVNFSVGQYGFGYWAGDPPHLIQKFDIYRAGLFFDTSSIPEGATIINATLSLVLKDDLSTTNFDIVIQDESQSNKPFLPEDYSYDGFSGDGGSINTATFGAVGSTINISLTDLTYIAKGGTTKLMLRSQEDIDESQPPTNEYVEFYSFEKGTTYIPKLIVNYSSNWSSIVNLTWSSNATDDGTWKQYGFSMANNNSTYYMMNTNFSNPSTTYYWNVSGYVNGTWVNHSYWFTTGVSGRSWKNILSGYITGGNNTGWRQLLSGYLSGGNASVTWNNILSGYFTGGNTSVAWRSLLSGYLTGGNNTGWRQLLSGYLTGGNNTLNWNNILSGYLTGGNNTVVWNPLLSGWLTGGNISVEKTWNDLLSGYIIGGNNTGYRPLFSGWFTGGNISTGIIVTDIYPVNGSTNVLINVTLSITVTNIDGGLMNISFFLGNGTTFLGSYNNTGNGTYTMVSNTTTNDTVYWWSYTIGNGAIWVNGSQWFKTGNMTIGIPMSISRRLPMLLSYGMLFSVCGLFLFYYRRKKKVIQDELEK